MASIQTHINIAHHASGSHRGDMPAYIVVQISIYDPVTYEHYMKITPPSIVAYGGRYIVRGGPSEVLEGSWQPKRLVVLEFSSVDQARAWWDSPEYARAKAIRQRSADTEMLLIAGDPGRPGSCYAITRTSASC